MHWLSAGVALVALVLYAHRSGWLAVHGSQSGWALTTRAGMAGLLASIVVAFLDLALIGAPFAWRHWLILAALTLSIVGHLGLRHGGPSNPT